MLIQIPSKYEIFNSEELNFSNRENNSEQAYYTDLKKQRAHLEYEAGKIFTRQDFMFRWIERDNAGNIIGSASGGIEPLNDLEKKDIMTSCEILSTLLPGEILLPEEASRYLVTLDKHLLGYILDKRQSPQERARMLLDKPACNLTELIKKQKMKKEFTLKRKVIPLENYEEFTADYAGVLFEMINISPQEVLSITDVAIPLAQIYNYLYDLLKIGERKMLPNKKVKNYNHYTSAVH